ncbi:hypothetical protein [Qipengyuania sp. MTN3-11]|uniref:hypothetical protein n=1 Tax=Qipengyuania sp. MTN3-11 TaxID=3056557 RepID=UPI0036F40394
MAGGGARLGRLKIGGGARWNRYARWRRGPAVLLLAVLAVLVLLTASIPPTASMDGEAAAVPALSPSSDDAPANTERDDDLALYDRIIARVADGEDYYAAAVEEQRAGDYPVRPGLAVRLPTLAILHARLGEGGLQAIAFLLLAATAWAWWRRLGAEPGGARYRNFAAALIVLGGSTILNRYYFVLHEFWTGMLIALSLGLHRPGRYWPALAVAALALALREHTLPFVLLMAAMALWRRHWREGLAWLTLTGIFALALRFHLEAVAALVLPTDPQGPPWLVLDGMRGWLSKVVLSSNLRFLPHWLAGPLAVLMVFGWSGWRSPAGSTATLLLLGYALAFMLAGRANNFYWGAVVAPLMFVGLAFVPVAATSLIRAARGR